MPERISQFAVRPRRTGSSRLGVFRVNLPIRFEYEYEETAFDNPGHGYANSAPWPNQPCMAQ